MNKTILFSPVGGTDPISWNNASDGSMLHICRHYKPDIVYLYMSKEILDFQKQDDRYRYCLQKLQELQGRTFEIRELSHPELERVEDFNFFYEAFTNELMKIQAGMDDTDSLLLNVSSGTPAMKSSLLVLATIGEFNWKVIQVVTPIHAMNEHSRKGYDVKLAWAVDNDNEEGAENRCREVRCPNLLVIKHTENIKKLIGEYDYPAALLLAKSLPGDISAPYIPMLEMANARLLQDLPAANRLSKKLQCEDVFPIRQGDDQRIFEYALALDIRVRKQAYSDFIRALTPLIVNLFENILEKNFGFRVEDYVKYDRHGVRKWDMAKLAGTNAERALLARYNNYFTGGPVSSDHLVTLIKGLHTNLPQDPEQDLTDAADEMRKIEIRIRNVAAHTIDAITNDRIKNETGFTAEEIMEKIRKLFRYSSIQADDNAWNAYDAMNQLIIDRTMRPANG